jgi:hypothetical protein
MEKNFLALINFSRGESEITADHNEECNGNE